MTESGSKSQIIKIHLTESINLNIMKKIFTLLALGLFAFSASAQRTIDLEVTEILSPTELNTEINGQQVTTGFPLTFVIRNNGTDSILIGDSLYWNTWIRDIESNQIIVQAPNGATSGNAYITVIDKDLGPTDTMHLSVSFNINLGLTLSRDVRVRVTAAIRNLSNPIAPEGTASQANNTVTVDIVWFNVQGWNVSVDDVKFNDNIKAFPNPANDVVYVQVLQSTFTNVTIEVYDVQGKLVMSESDVDAFENNYYELNTSELKEGIYILKVNNGETVNTTKIQVSH